ncbi:MAG: amino acid adenylation domain-containing protein [Nitrospira sp. CR2.1]|nr:amino acid adenylation domain-containing protein [Nitrospira sp. CR2.1]
MEVTGKWFHVVVKGMHKTLTDLLRFRASTTPARHAYSYLLDGEANEVRWDYGELDRRARGIAAWLQSVGAEGSRALLLYPPGLDYVAAFFGCLYAGVVAVPAYPPQRQRGVPRIRAILADSRAEFALATTVIRDTLARVIEKGTAYEDLAGLQWLNTDQVEPGVESHWTPPRLTPDTPAFLQYTSGSTGTPKGVRVSHGNLLHNQRAIQESFGHTSEDVIVGWLPLYHDMGLIGNVLQPLYVGASCILMSPVHFLQKPVRWLSAITRYGGTTSGGPNFSYELCARQVTDVQRADLDLSSWTVAFNGAEPVRAATIERFSQRFGACGFRRQAFYPCYGLAEATLLVTGGTKGADLVVRSNGAGSDEARRSSNARDNRIVGCGRARAGQSVRIVHPDSGIACLDGQEGEIWVHGPSVAQGYWENEDASKATFQATLATSGEGPFLRTGDLGFLHDGDLFVTGRIKDLIIVRGRNHYPQDIERTVEECHRSLRPGGCAAFSVTEEDEERLVVVQEVSPRAGTLDVPAITDAIRQAVAHAHEVAVSAIVLIKAGSLPKTSSGKVQRGLCRTQFLARSLATVGESTLKTAPDAPAPVEILDSGLGENEALQATLAELWSQVLNRPTVGPQDDFFALGGDSLCAVRMVAQLKDARGIEIAPDTLFEHSTLAAFSRFVGSVNPASAESSREPLTTTAREGTLPLSFSQERFWFFEQLSPGSSINNIPVALRLRGPLEVEALRSAVNEIVRRHEILRASFAPVEGRPSHVIAPHLSLPLAIERPIAAGHAERDADILAVLQAEACRPFDLAAGPLIRCRLFRLAETDHLLSVTLHHIVADGQSMEIIRRDLSALYAAFTHQEAVSLPALPLQYVDVAAWQRRQVHSDVDSRQLEYWRSRLDGVPPLLTLPWDYSRPAVQGHRGARYSWTISPATGERLQDLGRRYRVTPFMLLLSTFALLLSRYSGQTDFCIGTPVANRGRRESEHLVGCFVNTVALRMDLGGNPFVSDLLRDVRKTVLEAQAHQGLPFERLVDELGVARELGHTPLFQVMFVLEEALSEASRLDDLTVSRLPVSTGTSVFDLTLEMVRKPDGGVDAVFEYSTDLFADSTIARMAGHLDELLRQLVAVPDGHLSECPMLSIGEQAAVLALGKGPHKPALQDSCLHRLIEAQTRLTPDASALERPQGPVSYDELNRRANRLARYLRLHGVGPDTTVGLCVDRSLELAVGLLGCLKAGAVYVPMDPAYPLERKTSILRDAQPTLMLTQAGQRGALPTQGPRTFLLDEQWEDVTALPDHNFSTGPHPEQLAYLLYTSGTTGQPKGIGISHRALTNHGLAAREAYGLSAQDRVLQFSSPSFDVVAEECFPTWLAGGTVVLRSDVPVPAYGDFSDDLRARHVTVVNLPTPYWAGWIEEMERTAAALPPSLRLAIVGSEKVQVDDLRRWRRLAASCAWCNAYGPTEATVTASIYSLETEAPKSEWRTVPIGRPIANVELYVLDRHCQPVPIGVPGGLYIGGAGVARGYHRLPALTAERFIPHPFSGDGGARLYRTGDLARRRADGQLEFLGRGDDQIKIRGFRVELQDIESHIRLHPQVKDARVWLESDTGADWPTLLAGVRDVEREEMVRSIERLSVAEAQWLCDLESDREQRRKTVIQRKPEFEVFLKINKDEFLTPPRANQRNWLLRRALDEFSDDLLALDDVSKRFVSGSDRADIARSWTDSHAEYRPSELIIEGQQVMQDWEAPLMKAMADIVTQQRGDVLEVGFGMGISASYIQAGRPRSHTIIECNRDVMQAFGDWTGRYQDRDIRLVQGRWQDVVDDLGLFDGVFFDTYPASEAEFEESVLNSINFAEGFIPVASKLLRPGGVFTYYTNEIDSFSRRHQRFLLSHFSSFTLSVVRSLVPPDDCHYWWADSMVLVKAVK